MAKKKAARKLYALALHRGGASGLAVLTDCHGKRRASTVALKSKKRERLASKNV